jgi:hypothetical protein
MNRNLITVDMIKGKKNRFKVGQKVKAKLNLAKEHVEHLVSFYGVKFGENIGKEIREQDLEEVYNWIGSYLSKNPPVGVVSSYGEHEMDEDYAFNDKKFVWVEFKFKSGFKLGTYVSEKYLTAVKTKSRKK